ncbi:hypothetical protein Ade02nite_96170 [Paractinoplanes deccanensis]|uniref:N-acetyltransferase domain-containing protein n=1 Tax=Paractinoplanes deccanensis TaxID=113561 RepID=A0ABQ3YLV3_9ACTN|nr:GNAT family N-acetyltransferase [Actinoplanes deccanensis]GID80976.1 hypothetical protein Ade02nite_96170 [Actinoplanes deccanensis]
MIVRITPSTLAVLDEAARCFGREPAGAAFVEAPGTLAFVAGNGPDVQGWCWGYLLPRPDGATMLYLHNLEVAPAHRRRGVGRALLRAFMRAGRDRGATTMFLTTGEHNTAARTLYESEGAGLADQGPTVNYWFVL